MGAGLVVVAVVVGRILEIPAQLAARGIEREHARSIEIVARAARRVVTGHRIAGSPIGEIVGRIIGAGDVEGATARLPGIVLVLPGLAAGLARRRDRIGLPQRIAGLGVERGDPVAQAAVAAGGADHDRILERERGGGQLQVRLVAQVLVPHHLAGLLVGRDHAPVIGGDRDHQVAPQRDAAIAVEPLLARIHLPHDAAGGAGANVDLVDHAPAVGDVHEAVLDQRGRLQALVAGAAAERHRELELQILDVRLVDRVQGGEALGAVVVMIYQPVLRLGMLQPLIGDVRGLRRRRPPRAWSPTAARLRMSFS